MSIRKPCLRGRAVSSHSCNVIQPLEERRMLCYADGGVIQHVGSRSHPTANAAQLLADAVVPVVEEVVIKPGNIDPSKPNPMGAQEVGSSRVDLQACKLEYSIVSPK